MIRSFVNSGQTSTDKWESEIKAALQELRLHGHEMSPYERNLISREIRRRQDELIPVVGASVINEFKDTITKYKKSDEALQRERTKEINRFDSSKLNTEIQLLQSRVDMAMKQDTNPLHNDSGISSRLQQLYSEAVQSGDIHKQRAALEVIKSISVQGPERAAVNELARQAQQSEKEFRQTDGTRQAQQSRVEALGELHSRYENLDRVSQLLGLGSVDDVFSTSPFARAAKLVKFTDEGPAFFNEDDPEVTGVVFIDRQKMEAAGGK